MSGSAQPAGQLGIEGQKLAALFGLDEREVRKLAERGIAVKLGRNRYDLAASIKNYCTHLREQAAARQGRDGLDNVSENAQLTRERRRKLAQDAAKDAGELIPIKTVIAVMLDHVQGMKAMILGISNEVQTDLPHLSIEDLRIIKGICEKVLRNNAERAIDVSGLHPEIEQYIAERQGRSVI